MGLEDRNAHLVVPQLFPVELGNDLFGFLLGFELDERLSPEHSFVVEAEFH